MTQDTVRQLASQTLWMPILIAAPLLLSALAIGLIVGMFQNGHPQGLGCQILRHMNLDVFLTKKAFTGLIAG